MGAPTESWIPIPTDSGFGLANLPLGVATIAGVTRVVTRVGDTVLPLGDVLDDDPHTETDTVNALLAEGGPAWRARRERIRAFVTDASNRRDLPRADDVVLHLPIAVGDFVDFYSSIHHATRVGRLFRPDTDPLLANWRHLPVGYHGRAGTVAVSGTDVVRPSGLVAGAGTDDVGPRRMPSAQLDFEVELGFVVGPATDGAPVGPADADTHVLGAVLVNDWSARDLQAFEYQPLGPFLGKSFLTSISPWVVPLDALAAVAAPPQTPTPDAALIDPVGTTFDVTVSATVDDTEVCRTSTRHLYWTHRQQFAYLVSNGTAVRPGDLFATGTVSGPGDDECGCLLEATRRGARPIRLHDGSERAWLADGDEVTLTAHAHSPDGERIDFGVVTGRIRPARRAPDGPAITDGSDRAPTGPAPARGAQP